MWPVKCNVTLHAVIGLGYRSLLTHFITHNTAGGSGIEGQQFRI